MIIYLEKEMYIYKILDITTIGIIFLSIIALVSLALLNASKPQLFTSLGPDHGIGQVG